MADKNLRLCGIGRRTRRCIPLPWKSKLRMSNSTCVRAVGRIFTDPSSHSQRHREQSSGCPVAEKKNTKRVFFNSFAKTRISRMNGRWIDNWCNHPRAVLIAYSRKHPLNHLFAWSSTVYQQNQIFVYARLPIIRSCSDTKSSNGIVFTVFASQFRSLTSLRRAWMTFICLRSCNHSPEWMIEECKNEIYRTIARFAISSFSLVKTRRRLLWHCSPPSFSPLLLFRFLLHLRIFLIFLVCSLVTPGSSILLFTVFHYTRIYLKFNRVTGEPLSVRHGSRT